MDGSSESLTSRRVDRDGAAGVDPPVILAAARLPTAVRFCSARRASARTASCSDAQVPHDERGDGPPATGPGLRSRVTPFRNYLRARISTSCHQMWNILRGDLSVVGPRPEQPQYVTDLSEAAVLQPASSRAAGAHGWAQVKYGYASSDADALRSCSTGSTTCVTSACRSTCASSPDAPFGAGARRSLSATDLSVAVQQARCRREEPGEERCLVAVLHERDELMTGSARRCQSSHRSMPWPLFICSFTSSMDSSAKSSSTTAWRSDEHVERASEKPRRCVRSPEVA
jgi:hypothetical protein